MNLYFRDIWIRFFLFLLEKIATRSIIISSKQKTLSIHHFIILSFVMENSLNAASFNNVNSLVQKIDSLTKDIEKALAFCLEVNGDKVAQHSVSLTQKCDTEFVDTIVVALHNMKNHLLDLRKWLTSFKSSEEMTTIVQWLMTSSDNLQQLLLSNNFFHNTFQLLVSEVQTMIDRVLEQIPVSAMAA